MLKSYLFKIQVISQHGDGWVASMRFEVRYSIPELFFLIKRHILR